MVVLAAIIHVMDHHWLKTQFLVNPDKSKTELAEMLGLNASAVSKILAGTRQIKAQEYAIMRRYFGLPVDGDRAVSGARQYVIEPLSARGVQDGAASVLPDDNWIMPARLLEGRTKAPPEKIRIFEVRDNAMSPDFTIGEHILVDQSDHDPSPPGVFIVSDGRGHMIRQCEYVPHSQPPLVRLSTASGRFESRTVPLAEAGLTGRVIARLVWL